MTKSATIPQNVRPTLNKPIPSEQPNIKEEDDGNSPTSFQRNVHMPPSVPHIILPDVPVSTPRVRPVQPSRVDMGGPISNLRSSSKKYAVPKFVLAAQFQKVREANTVTHQISRVAQEYRHLVKVSDRIFLKRSFVNELGQLSQDISEL